MKQITEKDDEHKAWYEDAKVQTLESLPAFLKHLAEDYQHDYGTICHACAAAALGAAWAMEHTPQGGITGFQARAVMWGFISSWDGKKDIPMRLLDYSNLLYPQYEPVFTTIPSSTWAWVQEKAKEFLASESFVHPEVLNHWKKIAKGKVPFGLEVRDDS